MIKLNDKKIKELILSGKHLKQSEFDTIRNRSEEFKNIVFRSFNPYSPGFSIYLVNTQNH